MQNLKIRIQALKLRIQALKIRIQAFKIRIQAFKIRIQAFKIRIQALKIRIQDLKIRVQAMYSFQLARQTSRYKVVSKHRNEVEDEAAADKDEVDAGMEEMMKLYQLYDVVLDEAESR